MLEDLKEQVFHANLQLVQYGLVTFTWGNVSGIDRLQGLMVIKPSGVDYQQMQVEDMVIVEYESGKVVEGNLQPSSDTPTHRALYNAFENIGGVVHTHSRWATIFAQAGRSIMPLGTTHADHFYGEIPCTRKTTDEEILGDYEKNTGLLIENTFKEKNPDSIPGILVQSHGPFTWGVSPMNAVDNAVILEELAFMNYHTEMLSPDIPNISKALLDRHFLRKHGENAYYGQK